MRHSRRKAPGQLEEYQKETMRACFSPARLGKIRDIAADTDLSTSKAEVVTTFNMSRSLWKVLGPFHCFLLRTLHSVMVSTSVGSRLIHVYTGEDDD